MMSCKVRAVELENRKSIRGTDLCINSSRLEQPELFQEEKKEGLLWNKENYVNKGYSIDESCAGEELSTQSNCSV